MIRALCLMTCLAGPAFAQDIEVTPLPGAEDLFSGETDSEQLQEDWDNGIMTPLGPDASSDPDETRERVVRGSAAVLRILDKLTGDVHDMTLAVGEGGSVGRLEVELSECRYPEQNPSGNAYAFLTIHEDGDQNADFSGWMIAQAPALNALEHPRYDVWVMRCNT
ncbi:hypothetical protein SAMN04488020_101581 [Palleronia marisminoris]|uniref:DUF2155 domain-containing protein n=1 Tax=Palleronia marisminoris TaxID=315423 RepID=A0A1Y5RIR1_9RHOB|nr:DUF2155 domain-containing protein [Palleronia marisminoris]SFG23059.1 hypothetical protein SAMN04488020_101581 [Palleronia marisminoris]SLN18232.1 hypothetical protein PAM7066_00582 [Palleronia marisminoris]